MRRLLMILTFLFPALFFGGMGAIVQNGPADLAEPARKAIILHNGREEVLILASDLSSKNARTVLRFIPFPSRPDIALAPVDAFENLNKLIRKNGLLMVLQTKGPAQYTPVSEIPSGQKLGAHDMTVVEFRDIKKFRSWTKDFMARKGLPAAGLNDKVSFIARDYIQRGFRYFVFDIVKLEPGIRTVEPVSFRFASKLLYYPLKTSMLTDGKGEIRLAVIAPTARDLYGMIARPYEVSTTAPVNPADLTNFYKKSVGFFTGGKDLPVMQVIKIESSPDQNEDILIDPKKGLKALKAEY